MEAIMRRAIEISAAARPHPNPRVGAVVVDRTGAVVAEAYHEGPGKPHAERRALELAGEQAREGTLVVTLEPCDHHGRTPPCTAAVVGSGVARVIVGALDPDPRVLGRGVARLRAAGIDVATDVLAADVEANDPGYFHHRRTGRPLVTAKWAQTIDGQIAAADGTSQWITSAASRADAHRLRASVGAVVVGAGTLIADDPQLTVRLPGYDGVQPQRIVVAGARPLPPRARLWNEPALVYAPRTVDVPAEVVEIPGPDGVDISKMLDDLGARGALTILVEGGPTLIGSLLRHDLIDRGVVYVGGKVAGGTGRPAVRGIWPTLAAAHEVTITQCLPLGPDLRVDFVRSTR